MQGSYAVFPAAFPDPSDPWRHTRLNVRGYKTTTWFFQAAGRFLILSYFGCLILRSEQVAGNYSVAKRQVADSRMAYRFVCMCAHGCICICFLHVYVLCVACVCMCIG